mgnify:FL=1
MGIFDDLRNFALPPSDANQIPTATAAYPSPTSTCLLSANSDTPGPMAGGISNFDSETGLTVVTSDREGGEPLYRRGKEVGRATEFVNFNGHMVIKEVSVYLRAMIDAAAEEGKELSVTSGFRTWAKQQELYDKYKAGTGNLAARPGNSNHQNGIAVDFNVHAAGGRYEWMVKNAWKYGFIRTCARERWHWEYWGDWTGQEKPEWAKDEAFGTGGHHPRSMFSGVPRIHTCGGTNGGNGAIRSTNWWNNRPTTRSYCQNHSDGTTQGRNNSWIGPSNEHLPDKFDRENPGWDRA